MERAAERTSSATRLAVARTRGLRELSARDPARAARYERAGRDVAIAREVAFSVGLGVGMGCYYPGWYCNPSWYCGWWWGPGDWCYPYGWGFSYWWSWGCYPYSWYCHPFGWTYWWWWGYWPYHMSYWYPSCYSSYYSPPLYYSTVVHHYYEEAPQEEVVVEEQAGEGVVAEPDASQVGRLVTAGPDSAARASGQYLTLGDQAFREGRYADAVHFYAKAVEFAPGEGVLYLVLSDGLFATGDYHYGAYALRKALDLDPSLAQTEIDKHSFYTDPLEFDRQLAVLESYLEDHPGDDDARLLLAANYLFGGRPAAGVDLLEAPDSERVRGEAAGLLVLQAARAIQYGPSTPR